MFGLPQGQYGQDGWIETTYDFQLRYEYDANEGGYQTH